MIRLAFVAALLGVACLPPQISDVAPFPCADDGTCPSGTECHSGRCEPAACVGQGCPSSPAPNGPGGDPFQLPGSVRAAHPDAGRKIDAGLSAPSDGGKHEDSGVAADAAQKPPDDAGGPIDAGDPADATEPLDAAEPPDAAGPADAADPADAGPDAGNPTGPKENAANGNCFDGVDNDGNGLQDCEESACKSGANCLNATWKLLMPPLPPNQYEFCNGLDDSKWGANDIFACRCVGLSPAADTGCDAIDPRVKFRCYSESTTFYGSVCGPPCTFFSTADGNAICAKLVGAAARCQPDGTCR